MTVAEYLQVLDSYTFNANTVVRAALSYGLNVNEDVEFGSTDLEYLKALDLASADMWDSAASIIGGGGSKITMGNRSQTEASRVFAAEDRMAWREKARELRAKWGIITKPNTPYVYDATKYWGK